MIRYHWLKYDGNSLTLGPKFIGQMVEDKVSDSKMSVSDYCRKGLLLSVWTDCKSLQPTLACVKEAGGRGSQQGGAIGNTLTGALAVLYSLKWTRDFKAEPRRATADFPSFKLHLLKYYMDDGNGVSSSLPPGSRLIDGRVKVVEEEIEGDNTIPADIRTSDIILEIANTISPFIDLTVDSPSRNISGWMPILDLQIRVKRGQIIYKFYKKSVSNKLTMIANCQHK